MSQRSAVRSVADHGHRRACGRACPAQSPIKRSRPSAKAGWTLGHGGRQVRIGPVAFWTIVGTLVVMAGWSAVDGDLFRISRRRADAPARAPGADAIRLRGPHRRSARPGRPARRAASCSIRSSSRASSSRSCAARRCSNRARRRLPPSPTPHRPARSKPTPSPRRAALLIAPAGVRRSPRRSTTPSSWSRRPSARRGLNRARR